MSGTHARPDLASYRDQVTELIEEGAAFGAVEAAIEAQAGLTADQKGALWLFVFSLRDRAEQQPELERKLSDVVEAALSESSSAGRYQVEARSGEAGATDHARPREFDANGFPVPQPNRSFRERVARLLDPP
jgi:hypothetical protein